MKKLFGIVALLVLFTVSALPQTAVTSNTVTKSFIYSQDNTLQAVTYHIAFAEDSTLSQATPVIMDVNEYINTDPATYPITYRIKATSTYGTPRTDIFLQGLFASVTDTITIDTQIGRASCRERV